MRTKRVPCARALSAFELCILLFFVLCCLSLGCGPEGEVGSTVSVRDSAGIVIVENRGELLSGETDWVIDPSPLLSIGTFEGDSLQQLFEVQGAVRLPDGGLAVANGGYGQVRVYGPRGEFVRALGRKGEGPGEFQAPALAGFLPPDTLVVVDGRLRRITYLGLGGEVLESATVDEDVGGAVFPTGVFPDGTVVVGGGFFFSGSSGDELSDGYSRRSTTYRSVARNGSLAVDFGEFPGSEFFMQIQRGGGGMMMMARLIPFGRYPMAAVGQDRFFFASGDNWEIQVFSPDGTLSGLIRWDRDPQPVQGSDLTAFIEARVEAAEDPAQAQDLRQQYAEMPTAEFMPAFGGMTVDARGFLWVERYGGVGADPPEFDIFDPEGRLVGFAALPEDAEILEIGNDYILALFRDELGIEYVRMYGLRRP